MSETSSSEINEDEGLLGRKRGIRRTNDYKRNIIKKARVKGTPYVNWAGKEISAKNTANSINIEW